VLDTLRELKLDANTLVVFSSDNGATKNGSNAPLSGFKASVSEGGMRVPTIAWWPGKIAADTSSDAVAGNIDLMPTFVKLAGGDVPKDRVIDGKDLWPLLSGAKKESPHEAYYCFGAAGLKAVRSGPWKLYVDGAKLYHLDKDIAEKTDVAATNAEVVKKLQGFVEKMDKDLGVTKNGPGVRAPGRVANPQPLLLR
jgi:arylsulfatase A